MSDPSYPVVVIGGVPVVTAPLEIDAFNAGAFHDMLRHAAARGHGVIVVDMTGTRFFDSAALRVLVRAHERMVPAGGQLLLVIEPDAAVLRVLAFTGTNQLIPRFGNLRGALNAAHAVVPRPLQRPAMPSADTGLADA